MLISTPAQSSLDPWRAFTGTPIGHGWAIVEAHPEDC
jgi:hypothetical protein